MEELRPDVRPRRRYDSSGRRAAAAQRRERILDVAISRFAELGWAGTTVAEIARIAEVSPELVGQAFGTKAMLLMAAFRRLSFGDQPDLQAALASTHLEDQPDLGLRLDRFVAFARDSLVPMASLIPALKSAAEQDPETARLVEIARRRRRVSSRELARQLGAPAELVDRAADEIYMLTSGEVFLVYRDELDWTPDQYADWLHRAILAAVRT